MFLSLKPSKPGRTGTFIFSMGCSCTYCGCVLLPTTRLRCTGACCAVVPHYYCSRECQKADWKVHRLISSSKSGQYLLSVSTIIAKVTKLLPKATPASDAEFSAAEENTKRHSRIDYTTYHIWAPSADPGFFKSDYQIIRRAKCQESGRYHAAPWACITSTNTAACVVYGNGRTGCFVSGSDSCPRGGARRDGVD